MGKLDKIIWFSFLICLSGLANAQDYPVVTQHHYIPYYYNPAEAGESRVPTLSALYRIQWSKLQDNPSTALATLDYPLSSIKKGFRWLKGAAGIVGFDEVGPLRRTTIDTRFSSSLTKSFLRGMKVGVGTRYERMVLDTSDFGLREFSDPEFIQRFGMDGIRGDFDLDLGFLYWTRQLRAGITFIDLNDKFSSQEGVDAANKIIGSTVWSFSYVLQSFPSGIELIPHLLYRHPISGKGQVDLRINAVWKKRLNFSLGYRQGVGMNFGVGWRMDRLFAGYANDVTTNSRLAGTGNTSEFIVQSTLKSEEPLKRVIAENSEPPDTTKTDIPDPLLEQHHMDTIETIVDLDIIEEEFEELEETGHIILEHMGFEYNSDILKPYAYEELDKLVIYLERHDYLHVQIEGHSDNVGSHDFNVELSARRALAVNNYLLSRGIEQDQLEVIGYGESRPIADNDTEEGRELNRRIEIKLIDKNRKK